MELRHLRYFVAVAEELHFSRAAKRLNLSQPSLSQQIGGLEDELGLRLFQRDKRSVVLTKAGEIFLNRARVILTSAGEAVAEAKRVDKGYEGKLSIGHMSAVMLVGLTGLLRTFRESAPGAQVYLRQMGSYDQYIAIINGTLDVGFVDVSVESMASMLEADDLCITHALHERLVVCISDTHELADRTSVAIAELADMPFISLLRQNFPSTFDAMIRLCQKSGFNPHIFQEVESMPVAIAMATAGYGVALVPALSQQGFHSSSTRFVPLEEEAYVNIYLISRSSDDSGLVRRIRNLCTVDRPS